jgi:SNF2 family DNA or RNA helicase
LIDIEKRIFFEVTKNSYEPSLIVVTENILHQWAEEFKRFAPKVNIAVIETVEDFSKI